MILLFNDSISLEEEYTLLSEEYQILLKSNEILTTQLVNTATSLDSAIYTYEHQLDSLKNDHTATLNHISKTNRYHDKRISAIEVHPDSLLLFFQSRFSDPILSNDFDEIVDTSEKLIIYR